jgi:ribonuclease BN (tRNA processing enzyme)
MSGLRFLTLGVGDAFSALYYSSCLALEAQGDWLLIDCPHPIRKIMRDAHRATGIPLDAGQITAVALSHLHADHCSGLEGFGLYSRFTLGRRARLLAHPAAVEHLWDGHLSAGMAVALQGPGLPPKVRGLDDFFELQPLDEAQAGAVGAFRIMCRRTNHSVPTTAFRIEAGGRTLGYSADTAFDPVLIDWLAEADLVVHETHPGYMHTPYEKLAALPADLRRRMRLIHYPDDFPCAASAIEPLQQGRCYAV